MKKQKKVCDENEKLVTKSQNEKHEKSFFMLFTTLSSKYLAEEILRYKDYTFEIHRAEEKNQTVAE